MNSNRVRAYKKKLVEQNDSVYQFIVEATIAHLKNNILKHVPEGLEQNFRLWLLDEKNPFRENYLQISSVRKTAEVESFLTADLFDLSFSQELAFYMGALNSYFNYEAVSDNLALGLSPPQKWDDATKTRREILLLFHKVMFQKLTGTQETISELLMPHAQAINSISSYEQSLAPEEMRRLGQIYEQQFCLSSIQSELEYSILNQLILNAQSCLTLNETLNGHFLHETLKNSLKERYSSNDILVNLDRPMDLEELIDYGIQSVLIVTTLTLIVGGIDKISQNKFLPIVFENGLLEKSFRSAACCVRLLNDIGTRLLNLSDEKLTQFISHLLSEYQHHDTNNTFKTTLEFLQSIAEKKQHYYLLTRIRKDIKHGEFNIALHNLNFVDDITQGIGLFYRNVHFYSRRYQEEKGTLLATLNAINEILGNTNMSRIILRLVKFHQKLYEQEFENSHGDYAVPAFKDNLS